MTLINGAVTAAEPMTSGAGSPVLVEVEDLEVVFRSRRRQGVDVRAVAGVSFTIRRGETFALVGESGSGKSTTARAALQLVPVASGSVRFDGRELTGLGRRELRQVRRRMQMVFQDPYSSLNPRKRIGATLKEALDIHNIGAKKDRTEKVLEILNHVGLQAEHYYRYPHEFSGGQRQRIGIARALMMDPKLIVCDEPVSALDVSIQSQIINLLKRLQAEFGLTFLFIAHDISVVRYVSDRIGVMYLGRMSELAPTDDLFADPKHPYTQALLSSVPVPNFQARTDRIILEGEIPSPLTPPSGCVFHTRCPFAMDECKKKVPEIKEVAPGHQVACHLY